MPYLIKVALPRGNVLSGEQEMVRKYFLERFGPYTQNVDQKMSL